MCSDQQGNKYAVNWTVLSRLYSFCTHKLWFSQDVLSILQGSALLAGSISAGLKVHAHDLWRLYAIRRAARFSWYTSVFGASKVEWGRVQELHISLNLAGWIILLVYRHVKQNPWIHAVSVEFWLHHLHIEAESCFVWPHVFPRLESTVLVVCYCSLSTSKLNACLKIPFCSPLL